jgi:DUF1680 family protein
VLSGISLDGERFFYVNPLEVWPEACARRHDHKHVLPERQPWFGCACCPPNIARLIASIGTYIYAQDEESVWIHLFAGSDFTTTHRGKPLRIEQTTDYPHGERTTLTLEREGTEDFTLAIRIPGWCKHPSLAVNGRLLDLGPLVRDGYARIRRNWASGDRVELSLPMPVERVRARPDVRADAGKIALQRGPVVYCLEEADNGGNLPALALPRGASLSAEYDPGLLDGTTVIAFEGLRTTEQAWGDDLYACREPQEQAVRGVAVPYHLWGNRGPGEMLVWMRERR